MVRSEGTVSGGNWPAENGTAAASKKWFGLGQVLITSYESVKREILQIAKELISDSRSLMGGPVYKNAIPRSACSVKAVNVY